MGITEAQYWDTPTLTVQWDLALAELEAKVIAEQQNRES
jgi:hypothetical protein